MTVRRLQQAVPMMNKILMGVVACLAVSACANDDSIDSVSQAASTRSTASGISYDNATSGLLASTVQAAIDELAGRPGTPGPAGPEGPAGPAGPQGPAGPAGGFSDENDDLVTLSGPGQ